MAKPGQPIVLMGSGPIHRFDWKFPVAIRLVLQNAPFGPHLSLDGQNQFCRCGEGRRYNRQLDPWYTIQYCTITGYGIDQQIVGISTKYSLPGIGLSRKNKIIARHGPLSWLEFRWIYALCQRNHWVQLYRQYCRLQYTNQTPNQWIKDVLPETIDAHTTIRYNVFTKDSSSSSGGNARPNLLTGGFPTTGWGSKDYYEIYIISFYNNPVEAFRKFLTEILSCMTTFFSIILILQESGQCFHTAKWRQSANNSFFTTTRYGRPIPQEA